MNREAHDNWITFWLVLFSIGIVSLTSSVIVGHINYWAIIGSLVGGSGLGLIAAIKG